MPPARAGFCPPLAALGGSAAPAGTPMLGLAVACFTRFPRTASAVENGVPVVPMTDIQ